MKIEIAEPGRMTQTGSSLKKLIQNNNMPKLDLLVRESIQNSLDARKGNSKFVEVDFMTGTFSREKLSVELEGITQSLDERYPKSEYDYLAIRDSNTVGLTGEMDYKKVKDNRYGNLLKLIYEICKPQDTEGAGGSWGIGKTVYFTIGIGLVVYYSRIINEDGDYESRLAASYVEDETSDQAMIPVYKDQAKRGIAWWGNQVSENTTQPVTNLEYINDFLEIFGIDPYIDDQTGTTIIIPFIDSQELLSNNRREYLDSRNEEMIPYWGHKVEDFLKVAVQRWYAPRLNNSSYPFGTYLRARINHVGIASRDMEPVFQIVQALYNRAFYVDEEDILGEDGIEVYKEDINLRKTLESQKIGSVSFVKVSRDLLKMNAPDNKPEPYLYMNLDTGDAEANRPIICYTRKPGMIVSYENMGSWVANIPLSASDEYIFGIFVLNTENMVKGSRLPMSIEEYVRKSEMADHASWGDWSEGSFNPRFVSKIQTGVNKAISKEYKAVEEDDQPKTSSGLSKLFGDLLLPPEGIGTDPTTPPKPNPGPTNPVQRKGYPFAIDTGKITYYGDEMTIPVKMNTGDRKKIQHASFQFQIDSEARKIELPEWEGKMGLSAPFYIKDCRIGIEKLDGVLHTDSVQLVNGVCTYDMVEFSLIETKSGTGYGIQIETDETHSMSLVFYVTLKLKERDLKPLFYVEKGV